MIPQSGLSKIVINFFLFLSILVLCLSGTDRFCSPEENCFPSDDEFRDFGNQLDGSVIFQNETGYDDLNRMFIIWTLKYPKVIVQVESVKDIQKAILFARKYSLRVTVKSTGHDFIGRSTADSALEINLSLMNGIKIDLNSTLNSAGIIDVEAGTTWKSIYREVQNINRLVVGAHDVNVGVGGFTLGGGISPLCRTSGLAIDNLLEVEMVAANGSVIVVTENYTRIKDESGTETTLRNTDLFWALRGGGGGTFGVATRFVFKLHFKPLNRTTMSLFFPKDSNSTNDTYKSIIRKFVSLLPNMPFEWGGGFLIMDQPSLLYGTRAGISFFLYHQGEFNSTSREYIDSLVNFMSNTTEVQYKFYEDFSEEILRMSSTGTASAAVFNTLISVNSTTEAFIDFLIDSALSYPNGNSMVYYIATVIGGAISSIPETDTAVHLGLRRAILSLTGSVVWNPITVTDPSQGIESARRLSEELSNYGYGMYPNEANAAVPDWQNQFWGSNYDRLFTIKRTWDPDNFFTCSQCVGYGFVPSPSKASSSLSNVSVILTVLFTALVLY